MNMFQSFWIILSLLISFSCATKLVPKRTIKIHSQSKYLRTDWHHWSDRDGNCIDTRGEILKARSLSPVTMNAKGCKVKRGKWKDYYYPEVHNLAFKVDIDHLVPLKHAHDVGASSWSSSKKEKFANDPENLVITNLKYNRQKGAKGIDEWLPLHRSYACKYIRDWVKIKKKYSLRLRPEEVSSINLLRGNCKIRD